MTTNRRSWNLWAEKASPCTKEPTTTPQQTERSNALVWDIDKNSRSNVVLHSNNNSKDDDGDDNNPNTTTTTPSKLRRNDNNRYGGKQSRCFYNQRHNHNSTNAVLSVSNCRPRSCLRVLLAAPLLVSCYVTRLWVLELSQNYEPSLFMDAPWQERSVAVVSSLHSSLGDRLLQNGHTLTKNDESEYGDSQTLALLYPPGLPGGYRNQVMRFTALVVHAKEKLDIHDTKTNTTILASLWLPSLLWSTQLGGIGTHVAWHPVPMDWIFDIEHWNSPEFQSVLPRLRSNNDDINGGGTLRGTRISKEDCWAYPSEALPSDMYEQLRNNVPVGNGSSRSGRILQYDYVNGTSINHLQRAALLQGTLRPIMNTTVPLIAGHITINQRRTDLTDAVQQCRHPHVYGGGTLGGHLWNDYLRYQKRAPSVRQFNNNKGGNNVAMSGMPFNADVWVYRALRPAKQWRALAQQCVTNHTNRRGDDGRSNNNNYIALHARVELEIMGHACGSDMERNLTKIIERVQSMDSATGMSGLFVAVSREGMEEKSTRAYKRFRRYADENVATLNHITKHTQVVEAGGEDILRRIPSFECGAPVLDDYYAKHPDVPDHGALLQSVINFYVAVSAAIFVGVKGSSYSTDVLTTRYWLGMGDHNYRYTKEGIERVEGLPEPHATCKRKNAGR